MMEDKDIHKILAKEQTEDVSVPSWSAMAPKVKRQNFFILGFKHINIYNVSLLFVVIASLCFVDFNTDNSQIDVQQEKISTSTKNEVENKTVDITSQPSEPLKEEKEQKQELIQAVVKEYNSLTPTEPANIKNEVPIQEPEIIINDTIVKETKETVPEKTESSKPKYTAKTTFVFETDTVLDVDTIVVDKKRKRRD